MLEHTLQNFVSCFSWNLLQHILTQENIQSQRKTIKQQNDLKMPVQQERNSCVRIYYVSYVCYVNHWHKPAFKMLSIRGFTVFGTRAHPVIKEVTKMCFVPLSRFQTVDMSSI